MSFCTLHVNCNHIKHSTTTQELQVASHLKCHMFQEVCSAIISLVLIATASIYPEADLQEDRRESSSSNTIVHLSKKSKFCDGFIYIWFVFICLLKCMRRLDLGFQGFMLSNIPFTNVFQRVIRVTSLSLSSPKMTSPSFTSFAMLYKKCVLKHKIHLNRPFCQIPNTSKIQKSIGFCGDL